MKNQCFAYVRVSTVKQGEGVSLEAQREEIERYANQQNLSITRWFEEKETAAKLGRPIFTEMIKLLKAGQAQGLVMHKIDRSARNLRDWATVSELQDSGVSVHFAAESVDFASRGGRLTADIQAVIAADYIRNLREETKKGFIGRLKQGLYPLKAPIGYLDNGGGKLKTVCPTRGPLVQQLFSSYAKGSVTIRGLVVEAEHIGLNGSHGGKLSQTCIEKMLANPFYTGVIHIRTRNETYLGAHVPLISKATFERIQKVKAGRVVRKIKTQEYPFRRLFSCVRCGRSFIPERQKGHTYYRCHTPQCTKGAVREEVIEQSVVTVLNNRLIPENALESLEKTLLELVENSVRSRPDLNLQIATIRTRRSRLTDALTEGLIDKESFKTKKAELDLLESDLSRKQNEPVKFGAKVRKVQKFLELVKSPVNTYFLCNIAEKREFVDMAFSNRTIEGKNVVVEPKNWLRKAAKSATDLYSTPNAASHRSNQEFEKWVIETALELESYPEFHAMCRLHEKYSNRTGPHDLRDTSSDARYLNVG